MAQQGNQSNRVKCCCPICQDLLTDPVMTPCGHNYCMRCIKSHFDGEDQRAIYSCPQCRKTFMPRPRLVKNTMLAELVEELKTTELQAALPDHCYAGPEDVACDACTGRKLKPVKFCLVCLVSFCEKHLQSHYESPAFQNHKLAAPSKKLKERTEKQKELDASLKQIQQRIRTREDKVTVLQQEVDAINQAADKSVDDCDEILSELIQLIKKRRSDLKQQIRSEQKTEVTRAKESKMKLEQEITELKRNEADLKDLCRTEDHTAFLLSYPQASQVGGNLPDSPNLQVRPLSYFEDVKAALSKTRDEIQQSIFGEDWRKMSLMVKSVDVLLPKAEPKTRAEFLKYSYRMPLVSAAVHNQLYGFDKKMGELRVSIPAMSLITGKQFLSCESLMGRCYWEVQWSGRRVSVAVAYKNIPEMDKTGFGNNSHSWALDCYDQTYEFRHDSIKISVSGPLSSRVGVYLDTRAGILSFYSVSDTMTLLHRVQATFTEPLYGGLWIWRNVFSPSVEMIQLE